MNRRILKNAKGFTLIEVIVSISVLAVMCTALVGIFAVSNKFVSSTEDISKSNNEVQEYINDIKKQDSNLIVEYYENKILTISFNNQKITISGSIILIKNTEGIIVDYRVFKKE